MSEIKPVYQRYCSDGKWLDINQARYVEEVEAGCAETRIFYPAAAYEALQKENVGLQQNLESEKLANTRLTEIIKENNAKMSAGVYTTNEQYAKEVKEHDDLLTAIEALEAKYEGVLDSIRQYKQILDGVPEGAFEGGWTARGIMKHAADLEKENAELKAEVKEWLCLDCNTVFPSESIPNSFSCLICPKCDGKRMPKNTAIIKVLQAESAAQAKRIEDIKAAINEYYSALDTRQHGGIAQNNAFDKVQNALGMQWIQRASLSASNNGE